MGPLILTLQVACLSTVCAFLAGLIPAYFLARTRLPGRTVIEAFLTLPMLLPPTVLGYYLLVLLGRNGFPGKLLNDWFGITLMFTVKGAVIAAAVVSFPLVLRSAVAAFSSVDVTYENAARTMGLGEISIFARISLPLAWRGILAGVLMAFARAMGEFGATLMIAGNLPGKTQTLPMAVYDAVQSGNDQLAAMLVVFVSVSGMIILCVSGALLQR